MPDDSEVAGLLALMLLVHARHRAARRLTARSSPWRTRTAACGTEPPSRRGSHSLPPPSPRPDRAVPAPGAIAAVHDEAESAEATDWPQIAALYGVLLRLDDNPVVALNHAVAVSMVAGPQAGLELVQRLATDSRVNTDRRFYAVRGHLLEKAGDRCAALEAYRAAARVATNLQQQRYLNRQVARLEGRAYN